MVGHESVDPKPQAKADLVTGVMCVCCVRVRALLLHPVSGERVRGVAGSGGLPSFFSSPKDVKTCARASFAYIY